MTLVVNRIEYSKRHPFQIERGEETSVSSLLIGKAALGATIDAQPAERHYGRMPQTTTLGADFARALAAKDSAAIRELIHPEIDFRGLTPSRSWEATDRDELISILLGSWFEEDDEIEALESVESDSVADRERVGYRFRVSNPDGRHLVEQQAYLAERDGQIAWMRVVCSGFRPADPGEA
jgi:hypothetical protein